MHADIFQTSSVNTLAKQDSLNASQTELSCFRLAYDLLG